MEQDTGSQPSRELSFTIGIGSRAAFSNPDAIVASVGWHSMAESEEFGGHFAGHRYFCKSNACFYFPALLGA